MLWASIALFITGACFTILTDILRGQEKSRWYTIFSICQAYGGIIFGVILVLGFGMGIGGLIWGQTLGYLLSIVPLVWFVEKFTNNGTTTGTGFVFTVEAVSNLVGTEYPLHKPLLSM